MFIGLGLGVNQRLGGRGFLPSDLFASSEDGAWYDPSDLTSMFTGRGGTSAPGDHPEIGDVVGIICDKSQLGGKTLENYFNSATNLIDGTGWYTDGTDTSFTDVDGVLTLVNSETTGAYPALRHQFAAENGKTYLAYAEVYVPTGSSNGVFTLRDPGNVTDIVAANGVKDTWTPVWKFYKKTTANSNAVFSVGNFTADATSADSVSVRNFKVIELPGNHLVAPSDAARPVLWDELIDPAGVIGTGEQEIADISGLTNGTDPVTEIGASGAWNAYNDGFVTTREMVNGNLRLVTAANSAGVANQFISATALEVGAWYELTWDQIAGDTVVSFIASGLEDINGLSSQPNTSGRRVFKCTATAAYHYWYISGGGDGTFGNVSLRKIEVGAGGRRYYLDYDGTDDQFDTTISGMSANSTFVGAYDPDGSTQYFWITDNATAFIGAAQSGGGGSAPESGAGSPVYRIDGAAAGDLDRAELQSAANGSVRVLTAENVDMSAWTGLSEYQSFVWPAIPNKYGWMVIDRDLTLVERARAEAFMATKSGATLAALTGDVMADLFLGGFDGGFYDPSDLTSMYVERGNATNTTTNPDVRDVVGTILDKSQMSGSAAGDFIAAQTNLTAGTPDFIDPGWSNVSGTLTATAATTGNDAAWTGLSIVEGDWYLVTFSATITSGACNLRLYQSGEYVTRGVGAGSNSVLFQSGSDGVGTAFSNAVVFAPAGSFTGTISDVVVKHIPGNHIVAPSDAARPVLLDEIVDGIDVDVSSSPELIANGTFPTDLTGWDDISIGTGSATVVGGAAQLVSTDGSNSGRIRQTTSVEVNETLLFQWSTGAEGLRNYIGNFTVLDSNNVLNGNNTANTDVKILARCTSTSLTRVIADFGNIGNTGTTTVDNVSVKRIPASAARRYYLDFDGTDDHFDIGAGILVGTNYTLMAGAEYGDLNKGYVFGSKTTSPPTPDTNLHFGTLTGEATLRQYFNDLASTSTPIAVNIPYVIAGTNSDAGKSVRVDGTEVASNSNTDDMATNPDWTLGRYQTTYMDGRFYGGLWIARALTTKERESAEESLAAKSGVTLA